MHRLPRLFALQKKTSSGKGNIGNLNYYYLLNELFLSLHAVKNLIQHYKTRYHATRTP